MENINVQKCVTLLKAAKSDNEKFAAMIMVPKVTKSEDLSIADREELLNAVGVGFLVRLLKSKTIPDGCTENVYKSMALSVLSGLATDPGLVLRASLYKVLPQINQILQIEDVSDEECKKILDDIYDLLRIFTESLEGLDHLIVYDVIKSLVNIVLVEGYGCKKALDLCMAAIQTTGREKWTGHGDCLHSLLEFYCYTMCKQQNQEKFVICQTVASILRCLPEENIPECASKEWYKHLTTSLKDIFTSKISEAQRDPALKLTAMAFERLSIKVVLPPFVPDCKLLLIMTHLCCIEVRMILENLPYEQILQKADLLCACYHILEHVISHMASAPSLLLDEKQILQLHSAMLGAFNAVIIFLKESSEHMTNTESPSPVVIATIRVLGSWLAEETSALRQGTYEILPFLLNVCKVQMQQSKQSQEKQRRVEFDLVKNIETCNLDESLTEAVKIEDTKTDIDNGISESIVRRTSQTTDNNTLESAENRTCESVESRTLESTENKISDSIVSRNSESHTNDSINDHFECAYVDQEVEKLENKCTVSYDVDVLRFLLPGLCHLTSEDEPRKILLEHKAHELFVESFRDSLGCLNYTTCETCAVVKSSAELLCGIFLNLTVLNPESVSHDPVFQQVTSLLIEACPKLGQTPSLITVWANMLTLGMFLLRHQSQMSLTGNRDVMIPFFLCVCQFIKGAYTSSENSGISISETYIDVWEDVYQLWFLCLQATNECLRLYSDLRQAMLSTGLLPHIIKVLLSVSKDQCPQDVAQGFISLIKTAVEVDSKAKEVVMTTRGKKLARNYKSTELTRLLK